MIQKLIGLLIIVGFFVGLLFYIAPMVGGMAVALTILGLSLGLTLILLLGVTLLVG